MALDASWQPLEDSAIQPNTGPRVCMQLVLANEGGPDVNDVDIAQTPPPGVTNVEWEVVNSINVTGTLPVGPQAGPIALADLTFAGGSPGITTALIRVRVCYDLPTFPADSGLHPVGPDAVQVTGDDGSNFNEEFAWTIDTDPVVVYCGRRYLRSQTEEVVFGKGYGQRYRRPVNPLAQVQPD